MQSKVFISHKSSDKDWCEKLATRMRESGIDAWLDKWEIRPGDSVPAKIREGLEQSGYLLLVLSPDSANPAAKWVANEWESYLSQQLSGKQVTLIPILLRDCEIPANIAHLKYLDFRSEAKFEVMFQELISLFTGVDPRPPLGGASTSLHYELDYKSVKDVPEEIACAYLVSEAYDFCSASRKAFLVFEESRRLLELAERLIKRIKAMLPRVKTILGNALYEDIMMFLDDGLRDCIAEAWIAIPSPNEDDARLKDSEHFKKAYYKMTMAWYTLNDKFQDKPKIHDGLLELQSNPVRWNLLGFVSEDDFFEWRSPTTKTLFQSPSPMELELLYRLSETTLVTGRELKDEGFPTAVIDSIFNRLARDKWANLNYDVRGIEITPVGRRLLAKGLSQIK
jgi:hypothetical protein